MDRSLKCLYCRKRSLLLKKVATIENNILNNHKYSTAILKGRTH